MMIYN